VKNLFSINKAADLLERDRATLVRALRHVKPDGHQRGQPRYTMRTITDALAAHEGRNRGADAAVNRDLQARFVELEKQYNAVQAAPTVEERRKKARTFFRFLAATEDAMIADARRSGEDPRLTSLRVAEHTRLHVATLRHALGWNFDEAWAEFMKADARVCDDDR
jgi:hypothetical protein